MSFPLILDDAAIFPPGNLALSEAVEAHRRHLSAPYADMVGPLVVTPQDLPRLSGEGPLEVAVVAATVDAAVAAIEAAEGIDGIRLAALEISDADVDDVGGIAAPEGIQVYVEIPRDDRRLALIDALALTPHRAKLRTGGTRADLYPDEMELASAVLALTARGVPFKATAGLHHALRNTDPETGFEQHGFLNLLAAADVARHRASLEEVASVFAERDAQWLPPVEGRSLLVSIGTCSIAEPIAELSALGLLDLAEAS